MDGEGRKGEDKRIVTINTALCENIMGNICKLYKVPMCEKHLGRLTATFIYCTDSFYLHLTYYFHHINSLC